MEGPRRTKSRAKKYAEKYGEEPALTHMFSNVKLANLYYEGTDTNSAEWYKYVLAGSAYYPMYKELIYEVRPRENRMYLKTVTGDLVFKTRNESRAESGPMEWVSSGERVVGAVDSDLIILKEYEGTLESEKVETTEVLFERKYTHHYIIVRDTSKHKTRAFINVGEQLTTVGFEDHNLGFASMALLLAMGLIKHREINQAYLTTISTCPFTYADPVELAGDELDKRFRLLENVNDIYIKKTALIGNHSGQCFAVANSGSNQLIYMIDAKLGGTNISWGIRLFQSGIECPLLVVGNFENAAKGGCAVRAEDTYDIGYIGAWAIANRDSRPMMKIYDYDRSLRDKHFAISALDAGQKNYARHVCFVSWEETGLITRVRFVENLPVGHKSLILVWAMSVTYYLLKSDQVSVPKANEVANVMNYTQQALSTTQVLQDRTRPNAQELGRLNKLNNINRMWIQKIGKNEEELVDYYCVGDWNTKRPLFIIDSRGRTGLNSFVTDIDTNETLGSIDAFRDTKMTSHIHLNRECIIGYVSGWYIYNISGVNMFFVAHFPKYGSMHKKTKFTISPMKEKRKLAEVNWDEESNLTFITFYKNVGASDRFIIMLFALKVQFHVYQTFKMVVPHSSGVNEARGILGLWLPETEGDEPKAKNVEEKAKAEEKLAAKPKMRTDIKSEFRTMTGRHAEAESEPTLQPVSMRRAAGVQRTANPQQQKSPTPPVSDFTATTGLVSKQIPGILVLPKHPGTAQQQVNPQLLVSTRQPASFQKTENAERPKSPVSATPDLDDWPEDPSFYETHAEEMQPPVQRAKVPEVPVLLKHSVLPQTPAGPQSPVKLQKTMSPERPASPVLASPDLDNWPEEPSFYRATEVEEMQLVLQRSKSPARSTSQSPSRRSPPSPPLKTETVDWTEETEEDDSYIDKYSGMFSDSQFTTDKEPHSPARDEESQHISSYSPQQWSRGQHPGVQLPEQHANDEFVKQKEKSPEQWARSGTPHLTYQPTNQIWLQEKQTTKPTQKLNQDSYKVHGDNKPSVEEKERRAFMETQQIFLKAKSRSKKVESHDESSSDELSAQQYGIQSSSPIKPTAKIKGKRHVHLVPYCKAAPEEKKKEKLNPWATMPAETFQAIPLGRQHSSAPDVSQPEYPTLGQSANKKAPSHSEKSKHQTTELTERQSHVEFVKQSLEKWAKSDSPHKTSSQQSLRPAATRSFSPQRRVRDPLSPEQWARSAAPAEKFDAARSVSPQGRLRDHASPGEWARSTAPVETFVSGSSVSPQTHLRDPLSPEQCARSAAPVEKCDAARSISPQRRVREPASAEQWARSAAPVKKFDSNAPEFTRKPYNYETTKKLFEHTKINVTKLPDKRMESSDESSSDGHFESQFMESQNPSSVIQPPKSRGNKQVQLVPYGGVVVPKERKIEGKNPWATMAAAQLQAIPLSRRHSSAPDVSQRDYPTLGSSANIKKISQMPRQQNPGGHRPDLDQAPMSSSSDTWVRGLTPNFSYQPTRKAVYQDQTQQAAPNFPATQRLFERAKINPTKLLHERMGSSDENSSDGHSASQFVESQSPSSVKQPPKVGGKKQIQLAPYGGVVVPEEKKIKKRNPWATMPDVQPQAILLSCKHSSSPDVSQREYPTLGLSANIENFPQKWRHKSPGGNIPVIDSAPVSSPSEKWIREPGPAKTLHDYSHHQTRKMRYQDQASEFTQKPAPEFFDNKKLFERTKTRFDDKARKSKSLSEHDLPSQREKTPYVETELAEQQSISTQSSSSAGEAITQTLLAEQYRASRRQVTKKTLILVPFVDGKPQTVPAVVAKPKYVNPWAQDLVEKQYSFGSRALSAPDVSVQDFPKLGLKHEYTLQPQHNQPTQPTNANAKKMVFDSAEEKKSYYQQRYGIQQNNPKKFKSPTEQSTWQKDTLVKSRSGELDYTKPGERSRGYRSYEERKDIGAYDQNRVIGESQVDPLDDMFAVPSSSKSILKRGTSSKRQQAKSDSESELFEKQFVRSRSASPATRAIAQPLLTGQSTVGKLKKKTLRLVPFQDDKIQPSSENMSVVKENVERSTPKYMNPWAKELEKQHLLTSKTSSAPDVSSGEFPSLSVKGPAAYKKRDEHLSHSYFSATSKKLTFDPMEERKKYFEAPKLAYREHHQRTTDEKTWDRGVRIKSRTDEFTTRGAGKGSEYDTYNRRNIRDEDVQLMAFPRSDRFDKYRDWLKAPDRPAERDNLQLSSADAEDINEQIFKETTHKNPWVQPDLGERRSKVSSDSNISAREFPMLGSKPPALKKKHEEPKSRPQYSAASEKFFLDPIAAQEYKNPWVQKNRHPFSSRVPSAPDISVQESDEDCD